ncbi:hypothetical protein BGZ54_003029 [Gamsiella multidivaricata]|nr:hypothetical protein BGZ54_003029 [Gamsiella multidivaricata]
MSINATAPANSTPTQRSSSDSSSQAQTSSTTISPLSSASVTSGTASTSAATADKTNPPSTTENLSSPAEAVDALTGSLSNLSVNASSDSKPESIATENADTKTKPTVESDEELSPEEAALKAKGLKSTHRPGFYIHINSPRRLRIQTKSKTFDLDRYCPHANADMLKWGVLRADMTLRCGVHYWGFDLVKNGQCIAHPDETLNACPVAEAELEW